MKKKNTMPERDWQQTHEKIRWRELRKRILVMGLTVAMVANTVDLSALSVSAKTDESETKPKAELTGIRFCLKKI